MFQSDLKPKDIVVIYPDGTSVWSTITVQVIEDRDAINRDDYVTMTGKWAKRKNMIKVNQTAPRNIFERILRFFRGEI
jgi:hypothetical protein